MNIPWYGELPERWEAHKLKRLARDTAMKSSPEGCFYVGMENVSSWTASYIKTTTTTDGDSKQFIQGDILFGKLRPYLAKVYLPKINGVCSGEFLVLRGFQGNLEYLKYTLLTKEFIMLVNSSTYGAKMPRASWDFIGNCIIPLPPREEQDQIVRYLDWKVSQVNKLITTKRRQIVLLGEQRLREINDRMTNDNWKQTRLGHLYSSILGKMLASVQKSADETLELYLCAKDVHFTGVDISDLKEMWFTPYEKMRYKVCIGDLLVVEGGAGAGGSFVFNHQADFDVYVQNSVQIIRPKGETTNEFLYYWLYSLVKRGYVDYACEKATIPHFTKEKVLNTPIPVVPLAEQRTIVAYLDKQCDDIDKVIGKLNDEITLLVEYRTRLISDVVIGRLDVRGVVVPNYESAEDISENEDIEEDIIAEDE